MIMMRWKNYLDSITINPDDFDVDLNVSHQMEIDHLSKRNSIWISVVNDDLVKIQNHCREFIFPLKHHMQITESGARYIPTCLSTGR